MEDREELRKTQLSTLRMQVQEGIESVPGVSANAVFDRLEAKYSKIATDAKTAV